MNPPGVDNKAMASETLSDIPNTRPSGPEVAAVTAQLRLLNYSVEKSRAAGKLEENRNPVARQQLESHSPTVPERARAKGSKPPPLPPRQAMGRETRSTYSGSSTQADDPGPEIVSEGRPRQTRTQCYQAVQRPEQCLPERKLSAGAALGQAQSGAGTGSRDGTNDISSEICDDPLTGSNHSSPAPGRASGNSTVTECVAFPTSIPLQWRLHHAVTSIAICTKCYVDYVRGSDFKDDFTLQALGDGKERQCLFAHVRMKQDLWPEALRLRDLSKVLSFASSRQKLKPCPMFGSVKDRSWHVSDECPGLAICEACFKDCVEDTAFSPKFSLQYVTHHVTCDMTLPFIIRTLELCLKRHDWQSFAAEAAARIRMTPCPKQETVDSVRNLWFEAQSFYVCLACYCDYFINTESSDRLERSPAIEHRKMRCVMGDLNVLLMMQLAASRKDHSIFWAGMEEMTRSPWCHPEGIIAATWHGLRVDCPDFAVCGRCVAGIFEPRGLRNFLTQQPPYTSNQRRLCAFNIAHPRLGAHLGVLTESFLKGHPEALESFASKLGGVPLCPRLTFVENRRWWGWDHANICEECYVTFAKDLSLTQAFVLQGERVTMGMMCDLYSPRMRQIYVQASQQGDPDAFLDFAKHRRKVFLQAFLPAQELENQRCMAVELAIGHGVQGAVYKSMGWSLDATVGHSYTLGCPEVGYGHVNELAFQGAIHDLQSREAREQSTAIGTEETIRRLKRMWALVE